MGEYLVCYLLWRVVMANFKGNKFKHRVAVSVRQRHLKQIEGNGRTRQRHLKQIEGNGRTPNNILF